MAVVAHAVDIAKYMLPLPPYEGAGTGEGISNPNHGGAFVEKSKKDYRESTAEEKLVIISEIGTMPLVQSVLDKYGVSKIVVALMASAGKVGQAAGNGQGKQ